MSTLCPPVEPNSEFAFKFESVRILSSNCWFFFLRREPTIPSAPSATSTRPSPGNNKALPIKSSIKLDSTEEGDATIFGFGVLTTATCASGAAVADGFAGTGVLVAAGTAVGGITSASRLTLLDLTEATGAGVGVDGTTTAIFFDSRGKTGTFSAGLAVSATTAGLVPVSAFFCWSARFLFFSSRIFCNSATFFSSSLTRAFASEIALSFAICSSAVWPVAPFAGKAGAGIPDFDSVSLSLASLAVFFCSSTFVVILPFTVCFDSGDFCGAAVET